LAKAYDTYIAPTAANAAAVALLCHRQNERTAYRPQTKPASTNFDLQPNSHMTPWSAI